ncbi:MAG: hypothetical protein GWN87_20165, partial [Desulfuromonadales bacterium]|nr:hypothetical protein [Desulfuromonadales bacterium]NIS42323.1 hypothetical protein [Desulfuromonadales bacterium]
MNIRYYISGHGLGHASRSCLIINTLLRLAPETRIEVVSDAAPWFIESSLAEPLPVRRQRLDVGAVQRDSLRIDLGATLRAWQELEQRKTDLIDAEVLSLRESDIDLAVSDVAALPCVAAERAGLPSVVISNFTWDWILEGFADTEPAFAPIAEALRDDYRHAALFLRLPFHGPFPATGRVEDLPLVARKGGRCPEALRRRLEIPADHRIALISFGGFGLDEFDFTPLGAIPGWTFLTEKGLGGTAPNLRPISPGSIPYPDLVGLADVVVTKPGYGIVSECIANDTAVLYTSRGRFREQP